MSVELLKNNEMKNILLYYWNLIQKWNKIIQRNKENKHNISGSLKLEYLIATKYDEHSKYSLKIKLFILASQQQRL